MQLTFARATALSGMLAAMAMLSWHFATKPAQSSAVEYTAASHHAEKTLGDSNTSTHLTHGEALGRVVHTDELNSKAESMARIEENSAPQSTDIMDVHTTSDSGVPAPDKAPQVAPPVTQKDLADAAFDAGDHATAQVQLESILRDNPSDATALQDMMLSKFNSQDYAGAIPYLDRALAEGAIDSDLLSSLVYAAFKTQDRDYADRWLETLEARFGEKKELREARARLVELMGDAT